MKNLNKVRVSVIIPVYNQEKYLEKCLNSLANQSIDNIELIVINDGSTDGSLNIINKFKKKYSNIILITSSNQGVSSARNKGIKMARGEYIGFVDSDDYIDKDMFLKMYKSAVDNNADIVSCNINFVDEKENIVGRNIYYSKNTLIQNKNLLIESLLKVKLHCYLWNKIYKRSLFEENKIFFSESMKLQEDVEPTFNIFSHANNVYFLSEKLYYYVQRRNSATKQLKKQYYYDMLDVIIKINKILKETNFKDINNESHQYFNAIHFMDAAYYLYILVKNGVIEKKEYKVFYKKFKEISLSKIITNSNLNMHSRIKLIAIKLHMQNYIYFILSNKSIEFQQ